MSVVLLLPTFAVGLYWWFARGRPIGVLYSFVATVFPVIVMVTVTSSDSAGTMFYVLSPLVMLLIGYRLPPAKAVGTRTCRYCAEVIKVEAVVCRYCGRDLKQSVTPSPSQGLG